MKKILSCLTLVTLGFTSISPAFAADNQNNQPVAMKNSVAFSTKKMVGQSVEADIVKMQKDGVNALRDLIATYAKKDMKETGNMKWSVSVDAGTTKTKVDLNLEKYVSIVSYLQGKQEIGAKGTVDVVTTGTRTDYETTPTSKDEDGYPKYNTVDANLTAKITFDGNVKIIGNDVYFTLAEFKTDRSGTANEIKEFDESLREIQRYVGKTYKISNQGNDIGNPTEVLKKMEAVFQVLETKSLFEVAKSNGNTHTLRLKKSTIKDINKAVGNKGRSNITEKDLSFGAGDVLTYQKTPTGGILLAKDKKRNTMQVTNNNGDYTMDMKTSEVNRRYKTREDMHIQMKRNMLTVKMYDTNRFSTTWMNVSWKDNQLASKVITQTESYDGTSPTVTTYEVNGPLDIWTGNMDLKFIGDKKEYGMLNIKKGSDAYSFKFNFAIDSSFMKMMIDGAGAANLERGNLEILTPETFETIK